MVMSFCCSLCACLYTNLACTRAENKSWTRIANIQLSSAYYSSIDICGNDSRRMIELSSVFRAMVAMIYLMGFILARYVACMAVSRPNTVPVHYGFHWIRYSYNPAVQFDGTSTSIRQMAVQCNISIAFRFNSPSPLPLGWKCSSSVASDAWFCCTFTERQSLSKEMLEFPQLLVPMHWSWCQVASVNLVVPFCEGAAACVSESNWPITAVG